MACPTQLSQIRCRLFRELTRIARTVALLRSLHEHHDLCLLLDAGAEPTANLAFAKWARELDDESIALFEAQAGDLLRDLGHRIVFAETPTDVMRKRRALLRKGVMDSFRQDMRRRAQIVSEMVKRRLSRE